MRGARKEEEEEEEGERSGSRLLHSWRPPPLPSHRSPSARPPLPPRLSSSEKNQRPSEQERKRREA